MSQTFSEVSCYQAEDPSESRPKESDIYSNELFVRGTAASPQLKRDQFKQQMKSIIEDKPPDFVVRVPQSAIENEQLIIEHLDGLIKGAVDTRRDGARAAITESNTDSRLVPELTGAIVPIYSLNDQYRMTENSQELSPQMRTHSYKPKYSNYDMTGPTISSPPVQAALLQM